jgi:hypothetical protein
MSTERGEKHMQQMRIAQQYGVASEVRVPALLVKMVHLLLEVLIVILAVIVVWGIWGIITAGGSAKLVIGGMGLWALVWIVKRCVGRSPAAPPVQVMRPS